MDERSSPCYEFEGFRLDTSLHVLIGPSGEPTPLPSRAFATLRYLVERSGQVVEKGALINEVWPTTVVAENNLNQCVMQLRRALGESAGSRRYILTIPGRGFKFVAPVRVLAPDFRGAAPVATTSLPPSSRAATGDVQNDSAHPAVTAERRGKSRRWVISGEVTFAVAAVLFGIVLFLNSAAPHSVGSASEFQALTNVVDSATAPVLSADGRNLAFIRGSPWMLSSGQIWRRSLPDGEYTQVTNTTDPIFAPTFTPDGGRIAFTIASSHLQSWNTWTVPLSGGTATQLLPNASALEYIGPHEVIFSEFKSGFHLGIVTAADDRSGYRSVYWPAHERGMAHFSHLSPDRKSVLVVEMNGSGAFDRCRLVPFSGHTSGNPVGPVGSCSGAVWSMDGKWMFFSVFVDGHSHLWRQRFPDGEPQQVTFGPTDEETVSITPDGHSLLTSIGSIRRTLWLHDLSGDRLLTREGQAFSPWLSADARRVYFLAADDVGSRAGLTLLDVMTGVRQPLLSGFDVSEFDVTPDEQQVVFTTHREGTSQVWIAPLDRHGPPRLLIRGGDQPHFAGTTVFFRSQGSHVNYLHRIAVDGGRESSVLSSPVVRILAAAPDGRYVILSRPAEGPGNATVSILSMTGLPEHLLSTGNFDAHLSRDGRLLYFGIESGDKDAEGEQTGVTRIDNEGIPVVHGFPLVSDSVPIPHPANLVSGGEVPSIYAYVRMETRRNIYRIPLH